MLSGTPLNYFQRSSKKHLRSILARVCWN